MNNDFQTAENTEPFIDATQNAVIQAVDNMSEIIAETSEASDFEPHPHEIFYKTPEFWVGFAFLLVVVFLAKPVGKVAKSFLQKRQRNIIAKIDEAEKLRDDAQKLLAEYERKFLHAQDEADAILQKSQREIELLKTEAFNKLEKDLNLRKKEADCAIESSIQKAREEISNTASTLAISIVKQYFAQTIDSKKQTQLIDTSLEQILNCLYKNSKFH